MVVPENVEMKGALDEEMAKEISYAKIGTCPSCEHDYTGLCPKAWIKGAGGACSAPMAYQGPCGQSALFGQMLEEDKVRFEERCLVCWPCKSAIEPQKILENGPINDAGHVIIASKPKLAD